MPTKLPPPHVLSKSTFMYGCQCPKRLWLHKKRPELRDEPDEAREAIFQTGTDVGLLARQRFPGGVDAAPPTPYDYAQSVALTEQYMRNGARIIYEAAFQYQGVLAAVDILVKQGRKWVAYEVKSTNAVKEVHAQDAALQYYVLTHAGVLLSDFCILHLNRHYIRYGALDVEALFTAASVWQEVRHLQHWVADQIAALKRVLQRRTEPVVATGKHCKKPYPCEFFGYCASQEDAPAPDYGPPYINRPAIRQFVRQLEYPLHFMDFETWSVAVPEYDGHWPFRQVPFQFSLHIQRRKAKTVVHRHYLAEGPHVHHRAFAERLLQAVEPNGSVLVFNKTFENNVLNHLKAEFADLAADIEALQQRLVDLADPFRSHYRLPQMQGSWSLKYVLPALAPELRYVELEIGNGAAASQAFYNLKQVADAAEAAQIRRALHQYCQQDTWGLVVLLERLRGVL